MSGPVWKGMDLTYAWRSSDKMSLRFQDFRNAPGYGGSLSSIPATFCPEGPC